MHLSKIVLKNFKSYKEITYNCEKHFNVIIGENNIGKSTLFEALLLWEHCYKKIITSNRKDFYKADGSDTYIPFNELSFLRIVNDTDLFFEAPNKTRITIEIKKNDRSFSLAFEISKPKSINNSYLRFKTLAHKEFAKFSTFLKEKSIKLDEAFFLYQTKPVSNILFKEPFMNSGQVLKKISLGKSGEVLRNKIITKRKDARIELEKQMAKVLGYDVKFVYANENRALSDEYIDLKVINKNKKLDIHLEGSGFLQVAEIFSTIGYLENAINILLIDEPDSHIHAKLQKKLLSELKSINNTQTFVISHNDSFVSELDTGELFYLNQEAKDSGQLNKLDKDDFDKIKKDFGGIILALDKLNSTNKICFVEGDDDIEYLNMLISKYLELCPTVKLEKSVVYYFLRGKDYLLTKLDHNKRLLFQLFNNKDLIVVFDKDFSTEESSSTLKTQICRKLGNNSLAIQHQGYCIESTMFSEIDKLITFLYKNYNLKGLVVDYFVKEYLEKILNEFSDFTSSFYRDFENKFNSQKKNSRPELNVVNYNDYLSEALKKPEYLFNKKLISDFFRSFTSYFELPFETDDTTDEYISSEFFKSYIKSLNSLEEFFNDNLNLLKSIYEID